MYIEVEHVYYTDRGEIDFAVVNEIFFDRINRIKADWRLKTKNLFDNPDQYC